jgi:hypothetical protein
LQALRARITFYDPDFKDNLIAFKDKNAELLKNRLFEPKNMIDRKYKGRNIPSMTEILKSEGKQLHSVLTNAAFELKPQTPD